MSEALIVEGREAAALAHELAERRGVSVDRAVVDSLREALDACSGRPAVAVPGRVRIPPIEETTPEQCASLERLRALVEAARPLIKPGAASDQGDLYDEFGLPI